MKLNFPKITIALFFVLFFLLDAGVLKGFGPRGPYSHHRINHEAYKEFAKRTGFELRIDCVEQINQANIQADTQYPMQAEYHCDNSEFYRCSALLDNLTSRSQKDPNVLTSLRKIGLATHIIQDFYSHSNWVEMTQNSYVTAPVENLKEFFLLVPNLQSGWHPFSPEGNMEDSIDCYYHPESDWGHKLIGATHGCMEKDSNFSIRGGTISSGPMAFGRTYHEIAGELAAQHTADYLVSLYKKNHPQILGCMVSNPVGMGCNQTIFKNVHGF